MSDFNKCPVCKKRNLDVMLFDSNNRLICEKCKRAEDLAPDKIKPPRSAQFINVEISNGTTPQ